jgi:hypothetical protein
MTWLTFDARYINMPRRNARTRFDTVRKAGPKKGSRGKIKATQKMVDGIQFKSMLEVFTYRKLLEFELRFEYEKKKFVIMQGFDYPECSWQDTPSAGYQDKGYSKVRDITYTPDFVGYDSKGKIKWVIECKGFANERFPNTWKLFKKTLVDQGAAVPLYLPKNQKQVLETIEKILMLGEPPLLS